MSRTPTALLLLALLCGAAAAADETEAPPFRMPLPDGWRSETIPFPLEFAPDLPYRGIEELRFAPGMFVDGSAQFWTYAFTWWVEAEQPTDTATLDVHLESYFRGLAEAVAPSRGVDLGQAIYSTTLVSTGDGSFSGTAETPDAFTTGRQVRLNVRGVVVECPAQHRTAALFALSPQETSHPVWRQLELIRDGFRCHGPVALSDLFELYSDPDLNLHHFLYQWARHERPHERWRLVDVPERAGLAELPAAQRRRWQAAVDVYRRELAPHDLLFGAGMTELRDAIAGTTISAGDGESARVFETLDSVRAIYLEHWWPRHDRANRAWIEAVLPALRAHEAAIAPRQAAALGGSWPERRVRVDLSPYTNYVGAYCSDPPPHVTISSRQDAHAMPAALESLFHEASHLGSLIRPLLVRLAREFGYRDARPPDGLWHLFIFYTAGELTRQAYATAGDGSYVHFGKRAGVYDRSPAGEITALDRHWRRYLNGELERDRAIGAIVEELTGATIDATR